MSKKEMENLSNIDLLSELKLADLKKVGEFCSFKHYDAQEQIIDRQSESTDVFFVLSGEIRVVIYSLSGREITLDDLSAGGISASWPLSTGRPVPPASWP